MNKIFKFKAFVYDLNDKTFVIGRRVMTCCEADIQFLGYEVKNLTDVSVSVGDCIYLECSVHHEHSDLANDDVVILHAHKISKLKKEEDKVLSF